MKTTVKQLSIFLENKIGSLYETMDILSKADIRIVAATIADTTEYGILRIITDEPEKAVKVLRESSKNTNTTEVIAIACGSTADSFYDKLKLFSADGVVIEYLYCFSVKEQAFLIMRVNDNKKALEVIEKNNIMTISTDHLLDI
ncbi:MAG: acetolactate synthase [Rikenellaceae bacterium]